MKIQNFTKLGLIITLVCLSVVPTFAQKKKKEKKEKAPYEWVTPKMTGNKDFDDYLKLCDTLWVGIAKYKESIRFFKVDTTYVKADDGEIYKTIQIVDEEGNKRSSSTVLNQTIEFILGGTGLLLDMANMTLSTATATLELPNLPLPLPITYAKYLKGGPMILKSGGLEIRDIVVALKKQSADIKSIRSGSIDVGDIKSTDKVSIHRLDEGETLPPGYDPIALDNSIMGDNDDLQVIDENLLEQAEGDLPEIETTE